jgi:hypothetical protein
MKTIIFITFLTITTIASYGQVEENESMPIPKVESELTPVSYRLFPTQNMWTFLKLNTRNGLIWQVQFDIEDDNRFETYLNTLPLVDQEQEVNNRFTLYPTENTWTFILLDQKDGRTWQVQWSFEAENRGLINIE